MALLLSEGFRNLFFFSLGGVGGSGEMAGASLWGWRFRLRNPESSVDVLPFGAQNLSFSCSFVQKRKKKMQNNRLAHSLWELVPSPSPPQENPGSTTDDHNLPAVTLPRTI